MKFWKSANNILGKQFNLFSSLEDALNDRNPWKFCNYDDVPGAGAFRDCAPTKAVGCQWVSDPKRGGYSKHGCAKNGKFSILFDITSMGCPSGSERVQHQDGFNDISGCGLEGCNRRYEKDYPDIKACKRGCDVYSANHPGKHCTAFSWAPIAGDRNHVHHSVCTLYDSSQPTKIWGPTQVFCRNMPTSHGYQDGDLEHPAQVQRGGRVRGLVKQWDNYHHADNQIISPYHQGRSSGYGDEASGDGQDDQQGAFPVNVVDLVIMYAGFLILCLCISGFGGFIYSAVLTYLIRKNDEIRNNNHKLGKNTQCV